MVDNKLIGEALSALTALDNPEALPGLFENELSLNITPPDDLKHTDSLSDVRRVAVEEHNFKVKATYALFKKANTFSKALKLLDAISILIKERHHILGYQYGPVESKTARSDVVYPIGGDSIS